MRFLRVVALVVSFVLVAPLTFGQEIKLAHVSLGMSLADIHQALDEGAYEFRHQSSTIENLEYVYAIRGDISYLFMLIDGHVVAYNYENLLPPEKQPLEKVVLDSIISQTWEPASSVPENGGVNFYWFTDSAGHRILKSEPSLVQQFSTSCAARWDRNGNEPASKPGFQPPAAAQNLYRPGLQDYPAKCGENIALYMGHLNSPTGLVVREVILRVTDMRPVGKLTREQLAKQKAQQNIEQKRQQTVKSPF